MLNKIGNFWVDLEKVTFAGEEPNGDIRICFGRDHWIKISGSEKEYIAEAVVALDSAVGCTSVTKMNTEKEETLYGMDPEGRAGEESFPMPHSSPPNSDVCKRKDRLWTLTLKGIVKYLHLARCCPPGKSCRNIPFGHEPFPDCDKCWLSWFEETECPGEGDI